MERRRRAERGRRGVNIGHGFRRGRERAEVSLFPREPARIASASAAREWPRRNENLERMARARREKGFCTPQARLPIRAK